MESGARCMVDGSLTRVEDNCVWVEGMLRCTSLAGVSRSQTVWEADTCLVGWCSSMSEDGMRGNVSTVVKVNPVVELGGSQTA